MEQLSRIPAVAIRLGVSQKSVWRLIRRGLIPAVRVGRQVRVDQAQLEEWIRAGGVGASRQNSSGGRA